MFGFSGYPKYVVVFLAGILVHPPVFAASQPLDSPALKVSALEGDGAINNIRERRAKDPVVRVEDARGQPVSGATVTFQLPSLGAGGLFPNRETTLIVRTDAAGLGAAHGLVPNNVAGEFRIRVTASYRGLSATCAIRQINAAPAVKRKSSKTLAILVLVAAAGAGAAVGVSRGKSSSSTSATSAASTSGTTITAGTPTVGAP